MGELLFITDDLDKGGTARIKDQQCLKAPTCSELSLQITLAEPQNGQAPWCFFAKVNKPSYSYL
jgi:hypothetical protein